MGSIPARLRAALARHELIAIDTAPLLYVLTGDPIRGAAIRDLLRGVRLRGKRFVVSALTEGELLVRAFRADDPARVAEADALLSGVARLSIVEVSRPIARTAAWLRAQLGLAVGGAVVAATALESECTALLSNDRAFARMGDRLTYLHLDDLVGS